MKRLWLPPLTAHMLSWAAFLGVVFWPFGFSSTTKTLLPDGSGMMVFGHYPGPFMRYLDAGVTTLLLIPAVLTGLAVWLAWRRSTQSGHAKPAMWGLGALYLGYCSVPIWFVGGLEIDFIGVFFLPGAAALMISAIIVSMTKPALDAALE